MAVQFNMKYIEISSLTGYNVEEALSLIAEECRLSLATIKERTLKNAQNINRQNQDVQKNGNKGACSKG